jgi:putative ABC transport system substrate-binding protein
MPNEIRNMGTIMCTRSSEKPSGTAAARRRTVLGGALLALHPLACLAQPAPPRIAGLTPASQQNGARGSLIGPALASIGLVEGKDFVWDTFWSDGHDERFPALAQAAVAHNPALIIVGTVASARAAQQATSTIPIVMSGITDPVGNGLVASYARPGGNITGTASMADEFIGKLLELTREIRPGTRRVAVLINPQNPSNRPIFRTLDRLARSAGILADAVEISAPEQLDAALVEVAKKRPDALITGFDTGLVLGPASARFAELAASQGIAIVSAGGDYNTSGAVVTYTAQVALARMTAVYVQKILGGARPADLPVQLPTSFELVINMRVARELKLKVPQSLLLLATKLLE